MAGRLMEVQLRVKDVKRSAEFYRDTLGIAVGPGDERESHFEAAWGKWEAASADLLLFLLYPADAGNPRSVCEIGFSVEDLDAVHAAVVAAGQPVVEAPSPKDWGRQATYADPDGNIVVIAEVPRT